jgi:MinD-like ATPase involved in chromosome partitioning or flagellar assembly
MSSNKGNNMVNQKIKIYTIHSQKGGAGKTSIAIAIAGLSYILHKQKTLIVDCDLTGTSIIDLFYGVDKNNKVKEKVKYLNSLLLATPSVFNKYENNNKNDIEKEYFYKIGDYNDLYYIPSSPIFEDIQEIAGLISQEDKLHFFRSRMEDSLKLFINRGIKTIIIDCPPGLFGLSSAMIEISDQDKYDKSSLFITSSDPTDYRALIPSYSEYCSKIRHNRQINNPKFIFNKCVIGKDRDSVFLLRKIFENLKRERTFLDGRTIKIEVLNEIEESLKKHGPNVLPFIEGFDMFDIISSIQALEKNKGETPSGSMKKWCNGIKELLDL